MLDKLQKLYNTLSLIEVKGDGAKYMGASLTFLDELIAEVKLKETLDNKSTKKESEGETC